MATDSVGGTRESKVSQGTPGFQIRLQGRYGWLSSVLRSWEVKRRSWLGCGHKNKDTGREGKRAWLETQPVRTLPSGV